MLCEAMIGLKESFPLMQSNTHLKSRETLPLNQNNFPNQGRSRSPYKIFGSGSLQKGLAPAPNTDNTSFRLMWSEETLPLNLHDL